MREKSLIPLTPTFSPEVRGGEGDLFRASLVLRSGGDRRKPLLGLVDYEGVWGGVAYGRIPPPVVWAQPASHPPGPAGGGGVNVRLRLFSDP